MLWFVWLVGVVCCVCVLLYVCDVFVGTFVVIGRSAGSHQDTHSASADAEPSSECSNCTDYTASKVGSKRSGPVLKLGESDELEGKKVVAIFWPVKPDNIYDSQSLFQVILN